jgi:hypothetical protein
MDWIVAFERPQHTPGAKNGWTIERHPTRDDALTFCAMILLNGGAVESVSETRDDGAVLHRLDHQDVLRELGVPEH